MRSNRWFSLRKLKNTMDTYRRKIIAGQVWVEEAYVTELESALEKVCTEREVAKAKLQCKDEEIGRLSALIINCDSAPKTTAGPLKENSGSQP